MSRISLRRLNAVGYESLDEKRDSLVALNAMIPWESFRPRLRSASEEAGARATPEIRESAAGRKPWDEVLMFRVLVLQALYNLPDGHVEYLLLDRLTFMRILGLGLEDKAPDARTVWLYREALTKTGAIEALFDEFGAYLNQNGYRAMGGQIMDATLGPVPRNRNTREENAAIRAGEVPDENAAHHALLIHHAPKIVLYSTDPDEHLVEVPLISWSRTAAARAFGEVPAEFFAPAPDGLIRDNDAPLGQEELNVP